MESFGKQLRTLREKRHLTVNQLATYSGVSAAGISRIENGKRGVPKPATIKKLADALKIPYEELMQTAGYIETVQETRAPYDTGCTL
ncbi:helix-turn-helix transcriptional regulator, partial [Bacillus velezensis]